MARITVEDCIDKFPSRFELVLVASNRARKLHSGETPTVEKDNDKNTVIALREIAEETIPSDQLKNDLIEEYQTTSFTEDEEIEELEGEENKELSNLDNDEKGEIDTGNLLDDQNIDLSNNILDDQSNNEDEEIKQEDLSDDNLQQEDKDL